MRYAGIDIASQTHVVAVVDEAEQVLVRPTPFDEDAAGYAKLFELLGSTQGVLVAMEATGHYWRNLVADLLARGFAVALINPLRTHRFAGEDLQRTKTDAIDALGIARFARQKRPAPTRVADSATEELRELVWLRDRLVQDFGDRVRQLHRLVDLDFPEFVRFVRTLDSELATAVLHEYPTAQAFVGVSVERLANLCYDGLHKVGRELAQDLVRAAASSVGRHHAEVYRTEVRFACEDIDLLRRRIRALSKDIERTLEDHEVGKLLTTIDGVGTQTAARLVAELGDIAQFRDAKALASYVGVVPGLRQPGSTGACVPDSRPSATCGCAPRSGCPCSPRSARVRGCVTSTNASSPRASRPRSLSSQRCGSCSSQSTGTRGVARPSSASMPRRSPAEVSRDRADSRAPRAPGLIPRLQGEGLEQPRRWSPRAGAARGAKTARETAVEKTGSHACRTPPTPAAAARSSLRDARSDATIATPRIAAMTASETNGGIFHRSMAVIFSPTKTSTAASPTFR